MKKFPIKDLIKNPILLIDRQLSGKWYEQLGLITVLFVFVLICVTFSYTFFGRHGRFDMNIHQAFVDMTNPETVRDSAYASLYNYNEFEQVSAEAQSSPNHPGFWKVFGLAIVFVLGSVFFTGLLIATITNIFRARSDKFRRGTVKYFFKKHFVFLGYNNLIPGMIQKICDENASNLNAVRIVVGVEKDASTINDIIKNRLFDDYRKRVVVLQTDSCNRKDLERLNVTRAKEVYIVGEHDDAYNLKCYRTIYELSLCENSTEIRMPQCYVNLQSLSTLALFRTYASAGELGVDFKYFHAFNFNDEWVRTLLQNNEIEEDKGLQRRIIIAGITDIGVFLARKAAVLCHYPDEEKPTIITFIDREMDERSKEFISQHRNFFNYCKYTIQTKDGSVTHCPTNTEIALDIEFEFIEGDLSDDAIRQELFNIADDPQQTSVIAICHCDSQQNVTLGLNLPDVVYEKKSNILVWVYQPTSFDLGKYLKNSLYKNVITFGMSGYMLDVRNKKNAFYAKRINHFFLHKYEDVISYSNQRLIDAEWEATSVFDHWSCVRRAEFTPSLLKYREDIFAMAKMEHKRKVADKLIYGVPLSKEDVDLPKNINEKYIKAILNDIITIKE